MTRLQEGNRAEARVLATLVAGVMLVALIGNGIGSPLHVLAIVLLLSPVWTQPAFPLDFDIASLDNAIATLELMRPVLPANLLGTPAAVVPAGMAEGLPVGVQVMGGKYTELRCLAVAEAIEQRLGTLTPIDPVTG